MVMVAMMVYTGHERVAPDYEEYGGTRVDLGRALLMLSYVLPYIP